MRQQTLDQALHLIRTGQSRPLARAARSLHGLPEGGWGDTQQAVQSIREDLPLREYRAYTVAEFVAATHDLEEWDGGAGRYRTRYPV